MEITKLLTESRNGDAQALNRLVCVLYDELHRCAAMYMDGEVVEHTLQPTALVNETYLRLVNRREMDWRDQRHFLAIAANTMRQVLVDYTRVRRAAKRGGAAKKLTLSEGLIEDSASEVDLVELDDALRQLEKHDERMSRVVELRFFAGMSVETIAQVLGVTDRTVRRDWQAAKMLLMKAMRGDD